MHRLSTLMTTRALGGRSVFLHNHKNPPLRTSVERYDEKGDKWEAVAFMSTGRSYVGVCVMGGRLYAVGGFDGGSCLSSMERYNEGEDKWELVASMSSKRFGVGVGVMGGRLYAVGGRGGPLRALSLVERYDEREDK